MNPKTPVLNLDAIKQAKLNESPLSHIKTDNVINNAMLNKVIDDFPEDYINEVSPHAGSCFIFKATDNRSHGYKPFEGIRKSIQLNYVVSDKSAQKQLKLHGFTAKPKSLFK